VLRMTEMTKKGTQVVYLTATLPPTLQLAFLNIAGINALCRKTLDYSATVRSSYSDPEYGLVVIVGGIGPWSWQCPKGLRDDGLCIWLVGVL
jgi:hypothetical protein